MSLGLFLRSLLNPNVTIDGRAKPEHPALRRLEDYWAGHYIRIAEEAARRQHEARERMAERQRAAVAEQQRLLAEVRARYLAEMDRPPVRQGRDL